MTGKIERHTDGQHTTLRLIGHLQAAHLEALQAQLESNGPRTVLDLDEVTCTCALRIMQMDLFGVGCVTRTNRS